ncbi:unnamed protein product [Rotaria sordida]|uniref:TATA-binding protein interacting (TIP20) domain-containing protein n=2 Tax=Rotaria sordida TaxID=392033 RepID=A0A818U0V1_9BILA|nr:unnamed protein product [Rotaria sordida]CAF3691311.1 unnamed protein product [Rotaria sordida]
MSSSDKDFRFMATSDLMNDLQKESIKLDDDSERRIVKGVLKLLEDTNGEVQNQAVKCLGPLVCKVKEPQIEIICDTLCSNCTNMSKDAEQLRDISSSGLKTVIASLATTNSGATNNISKKIMQRLLAAIQQGTTTTNTTNTKKTNNALDLANGGQSQLEILDIISDMLSRFGANLSSFHPQLKQILLSHLNSNRSAVRKRVTTSLSYLLETCDLQLFNEILTNLLNELQHKPTSASMNKKSASAEANATIKTYVQALTSICRLASQRLSEHMHEIVRITLSFIENTPSNNNNDDQQYDDELIEYCLQALETYLKRCPKETNEFVPKIVNICIVYLKYDPNFNYDDDDNTMSDDQSDDDDADDDKDQDSYSDDDDLSWKVRHSAAKCIEAVVVTQHDISQTNYYRKIVPVLIERFLERENTVKADVFHCFITILQQTKTTYAHQQLQQQQYHSTICSSIHDDEDSMDTDHLTTKNSYVSPLAEYVPSIVRSLAKIMKDKDTKNREGSLVVLTNLVQVQHNILIDHIDTILPNTLYSLSISDKTKKTQGSNIEGKSTQTISKSLHSNLKITALAFLYALLQTHDNSTRFHKHIKSMLPLIISHANDSFYKIASEALLVLQESVKIIRPKSTITIQNEFKPFVEQIYECTQKRLKQKDFDQEVKERAITCFAYVIVYLGDLLSSDQLQSCWPILIELLRNEITRLPTVRALTNIIESPLHLDLQTILIETVPILSSYLRQNHRTLKMNTLSCLRSMIKLYSKHFNKTMLKTILIELPLLINENDLLLAQYALKLTTSICKINNNQINIDKEQIHPILNKVLELIQSPLLQGTALDAVIEFLCALVPQSISYEELVKLLIKPIYSQQKSTTISTTATNTSDHHQQQQLVVHRQAFYSIAKSFASLTVANLKESNYFIKKFQDDLHDSKCSDSIKILALLCLGETGKYTDLAQSSSNLQQILLDIFSSPSDDLRTAASYTLGYIGIRNLNSHIPFLLNEIARSQTKRQYLLLHSLREIIAYQSHENLPQLDEHIDSIWRTLFAHCECPEEGTRNVVAECLGKLTLLKPEKLLPILRETFINHAEKQQSSSPYVRSTIITAIKFTIVDQPQHIDTILKGYIKDFLNGLEDKDIDVRRVALVMFNSAAHNKPMLIRDLLKELLPKLYNETRVRPELIREVEMGPFKHTVDDGLDLRKAAYECMYTLLDTCLDKLDMFDYLTYVEDGLKQDHYDIRMLTFLMVVRLSILCPTIVLQRLDRLVQPLKAILQLKVKANSIKQEFEKHDELRRAAIKVFLALQQIKDANKIACINEFEALVKSSKEYQDLYNTVIHEQQQSSSGFSFNTNNNSEAMDMS